MGKKNKDKFGEPELPGPEDSINGKLDKAGLKTHRNQGEFVGAKEPGEFRAPKRPKPIWDGWSAKVGPAAASIFKITQSGIEKSLEKIAEKGLKADGNDFAGVTDHIKGFLRLFDESRNIIPGDVVESAWIEVAEYFSNVNDYLDDVIKEMEKQQILE